MLKFQVPRYLYFIKGKDGFLLRKKGGFFHSVWKIIGLGFGRVEKGKRVQFIFEVIGETKEGGEEFVFAKGKDGFLLRGKVGKG